MKTKERIWRTALELFNEKGLEAVGVREIARQLDISPGNLGYHFPTKAQLVGELIAELRKLNDQSLSPAIDEHFTCATYLDAYHQTFQNQYTFRFMQYAGAGLFDQYPDVYKTYKKYESRRRQSVYMRLMTLVANQQLKESALPHIPLMVNQTALMARFWLQESRISFPDVERDRLINHYLILMAGVFRPYATEAGEASIQEWATRHQAEMLIQEQPETSSAS